ncbi:hypothetical protein VP1G_10874 [Cytospora mali]|uniref:Uncharacterized protein n=1 Tax=Cytospora mali TaxID=578113 RepID=A0A194V070_CYTMA|nr:hypothetical protein VP1G_10874 [Valsa mali var. pyri (nom. inval.)]
MLESLLKKLRSLLKSPKQTVNMPFTKKQTLPMRYADTDVLEKQLNKVLGEDGWEHQGTEGQQRLERSKKPYGAIIVEIERETTPFDL